MGVAGVRGGRGGAQRERHGAGCPWAGGGVHRGPQFEHGLQVTQLLGGRAENLGVVGGFQGGGERVRQVVALARVVGALGRTGLPGKESGERTVQPDSLAR